MLRTRLAAATAVAAMVALQASGASATTTVYNINQTSTTPEVGGELTPLSSSVNGTISTDGTIGALVTANITGWDLLLTDNVRPGLSSHLTPSNSGIWYDSDLGLTATATQLSFDFGKAGAVFIIQGTTHGFSSGYEYFCFQATSGPCVAGETIVPNFYGTNGVLATGFVGSTPLGPPPTTPGVPEPGTWALMLMGVAGLGAAMRGARRKLAAA